MNFNIPKRSDFRITCYVIYILGWRATCTFICIYWVVHTCSSCWVSIIKCINEKDQKLDIKVNERGLRIPHDFHIILKLLFLCKYMIDTYIWYYFFNLYRDLSFFHKFPAFSLWNTNTKGNLITCTVIIIVIFPMLGHFLNLFPTAQCLYYHWLKPMRFLCTAHPRRLEICS